MHIHIYIGAATLQAATKNTFRDPYAAFAPLRRNYQTGLGQKWPEKNPYANLPRHGILGVFTHLARNLCAALAKPYANLAR